MSARWTDLSLDEKWDAIKSLMREGLSATEMAVELGAPSRNAVLGAIHRARQFGYSFGVVVRNRAGRPKGSSKPRKPRAPKVAKQKVIKPKHPVYSEAEMNAARRKAEAERVRQEKAAQIKSAAAGAEEWIRKNGVRRFEAGMRTDVVFIKAYLAKHGVKVSGAARSMGARYNVSIGPGQPKKVDLRGLMEIFDTYRVKEGLEPVLQQAG